MTPLLRSRALAPAAFAAVALSACSLGGGDSGERDRGPSGPFGRLETRASDKLTFRDVERLAGVEIPASATGLRTFYQRFMESRVIAGFTLPREDLDTFLSRSRFREPLRRGRVTVFARTATGDDIGWRDLSELERRREEVAGLEESSESHGSRAVTVDFTDPRRPVVYLFAATR
ncbi:MAG: hypothetical protein M3N16_05175 [Actinomycetota bacterium]|nr:hypothetical protein [Actinomycetota bacterium]